jgi:DNA-binding LacI/PurR family transcriptional regulator
VLALNPARSAILALSAPFALEVLGAATHTGLRVADDAAVVGVGDFPGPGAPGPTAVFAPYRPMGEQAGNLLWSIRDRTPTRAADALPTHLVVRAATGPARARTSGA